MNRVIFTLVILVLLSAVYGQPPPKIDSEPQKIYGGIGERRLFDFLQQRQKREASHVFSSNRKEMLELANSETHDRSKREAV
ncbi:hypothetical protein CHS0354_002552 [Potamilus streckersoni]|uniref:Uncharacterized protein n=1 Tax=Potamilus streckersoni TaxID=2493646 RepID=A0AAE0VF61_9BIVA|nr:hypothetical protein CHS0354_002552 [Potamilus streckersoni]